MTEFEKWASQFDQDGDDWEDMKRDEIFNAGFMRGNKPDIDLGAIHMVLRKVWARELSADDGLDEIEAIVESGS